MTEKESLTDAVGTSFDLFDALAEAVFLLDDEGRITSANAAAETLIGRTRRALSGVDVAEFLPEAAGWFRRRAAAPGAVEAASFMRSGGGVSAGASSVRAGASLFFVAFA